MENSKIPHIRSLYHPLDDLNEEIRLFVLHPSESPESPLEGELATVSLLTHPIYEALSYAWGEPNLVEPVVISGSTILVTHNLNSALRHLRLPNAARKLWIDAICIDQKSLPERAHQVTLMKKIYSECERDLLWLGPTYYRHADTVEAEQLTQEQISSGFELMVNIANKDIKTLQSMEERWDEHETKTASYGFGRVRAKSKSADPDEPSASHKEKMLTYAEMDALYYAFERPSVWSRIWVMQELSVAPNIQLVAGNHTLNWDILSSFLGESKYADAFHSTFSHGSVSPAMAAAFGGVQRIDHQRRIMQDTRTGNGESRLLDVLARFRSMKASDPRDQIYGLLGMTTDTLDIKVDYNKTPQEVYAEVTTSIINHAGHLDILCQSPWKVSQWWRPEIMQTWAKDLPSWVADFRYNGDVSLFAQRSIYNAGRSSCKLPCEVTNGNTLRARGIELGRVAEIRQEDYDAFTHTHGNYTLRYHARKKREESPVVLKWLELYLGLGPLVTPGPEYTYVTGEPALTAFWRTLIRDCEAYPIARLTRQQIEQTDAQVRVKLLDILRVGQPEAGSGVNASLLPDHKIRRFLYEILDLWTFAMTENGLYMLILPSTRMDDIVVCLDGAKVPVVLRPVPMSGGEVRYQYVTVAYVHGFMDMEAVTDQSLREKLGLQEREFLLV